MNQRERDLWRMLYRSQVALAKRILADMNAAAVEAGEWPAGQRWSQCNGSSRAIFFRKAREESAIPDDQYLEILRGDADAGEIAEEELMRADAS